MPLILNFCYGERMQERTPKNCVTTLKDDLCRVITSQPFMRIEEGLKRKKIH